MQIPKDEIIKFLQQHGQGDKATQASEQLPDQVDTDQHSDLLGKLGINPQDLTGGLGDITGKIGL